MTSADGPTTPVRNSWFHGELLDAAHLQLEQDYGIGKRRLLQRLLLGSGVVAGLGVAPSSDGTRLVISAGLALDGAGRELVVPADGLVVDPRQPTDPVGRVSGAPLAAAAVVTVSLAYAEQPADPVPAYAPSTDGLPESHPSVVRELPVVVVTAGEPPAGNGDSYPPDLLAPADGDIAGALRRAVAGRMSAPLPASPAAAVALARVVLPAAGTALTPDAVDSNVRPVVLGTGTLAALLVALAGRGTPGTPAPESSAAYVSGDAQQASVGAVLAAPLVVSVAGVDGSPLVGVSVSFAVRGGSAAVSGDGTTFSGTAELATGSDGRAHVQCRLDGAGLATVAAVVPGVPNATPVVFVALATPANESHSRGGSS